MSAVAIGPSGRTASLEVDADGKLKVSGTFSADPPEGAATDAKLDEVIDAIENITVDPPVGGATEAKQDAQIALMPTPVNSAGAALPSDFDYLAETYGYTGDDLTTIVKTKGADTYTQTLTYSSGKVTAASKWVKT